MGNHLSQRPSDTLLVDLRYLTTHTHLALFADCNFVCRPFFCGRKPSKAKRSQGRPLATKAGTKAVAPGRHCTSTPALTASRTRKKPGSLMPGVPASLISATFSPASSRLTMPADVPCSLNASTEYPMYAYLQPKSSLPPSECGWRGKSYPPYCPQEWVRYIVFPFRGQK